MLRVGLSDSAALSFYVVYSLWGLSEIVGGGVIPCLHRRGKRIEKMDRGSRFVIIGSVFLSIAIAYTFSAFGITVFPGWISYLGTGLMAAGIVLRQWSIAVPGSFFSPTVGSLDPSSSSRIFSIAVKEDMETSPDPVPSLPLLSRLGPGIRPVIP